MAQWQQVLLMLRGPQPRSSKAGDQEEGEEEMEREREDDLLSGRGLWLQGEKEPCSKSATP